MNSIPAPAEPDFAAFIGLDWGDRSHALALHDPAAAQTESIALNHSAENLHQWLDQLEARFGARPVALAIEGTRGAIFPVLLERPWLHVFAVHPATSARYRSAFTPSGAKDDLPDAQVLLELLERHRDKLTPLALADAATRQLAGLCEARRDLVDRRTQLLNQLTSLLKKYYPQALELVGDNLASPLALDFLKRWPDLLALKSARPATIKSFYYTHNVRRPETVQTRLDFIARARALTTDEAIVVVAVRQLRVLVEQLRVVQKHLGEFDAAIASQFKAHPDASLFRDLPGAGAVLAPRLLIAFGAERDRYPNPSSLQKYSGLAPVREKSGGSLWTHWRWHAPTFLRQSFVEWAGQTVVYCPWAKAYYQLMKAKGKGHWAILRALAFKWVRILWKCWQDRTPYDEARYLQQLRRRRSPLAALLSTIQLTKP
jgi:transposase